jgi:L-fuconolactonase
MTDRRPERIIDSHHHFWDPTQAEYPWMAGDEMTPIRRPFGPTDFANVAVPNGVVGSVLVQTRSSLEETRQFLAIAESDELVRGVVGWVDLTDPNVASVIAHLKAGPGGDRLVGIRHQVHDEEDPDWLARADVRFGIAAVSAAGLVYDLLVRTRELPAAVDIVRSMPTVHFVIDHVAKPQIRERIAAPWADLMRALGRLPNVFCKLSGMVTEADWDGWKPADLQPYVEHVVRVFGPRRVMWGSDWPVCLLAASYGQVLDTALTLTAPVGRRDQEMIFSGTAIRCYGLRV